MCLELPPCGYAKFWSFTTCTSFCEACGAAWIGDFDLSRLPEKSGHVNAPVLQPKSLPRQVDINFNVLTSSQPWGLSACMEFQAGG